MVIFKKRHHFFNLLLIALLVQIVFTTELLAQNNYKLARARNGDGIITLLSRHGLSPKIYQDAFIKLNKAKLGKNNSLFKGKKYKLP